MEKTKAMLALERIELKRELNEYLHISQTATVDYGPHKGEKLYRLPESEKMKLRIHVSIMTGKLEGIAGVGTTCACNGNCLEAIKDGNSPCASCFAMQLAAQYNALRQWLEFNYDRLAYELIPESELRELCERLAKFQRRLVRIEFAGDVGSVIHATNYLRLIAIGREYGLYFGVWTKLLHVWESAFNDFGYKPENMTFLFSAPGLNQTELSGITEKYWFVDCIFVVCDADQIENVAKVWESNGHKVHYCKCDKGSCANRNICGFCYNSESQRKPGEKAGIILEALR